MQTQYNTCCSKVYFQNIDQRKRVTSNVITSLSTYNLLQKKSQVLYNI